MELIIRNNSKDSISIMRIDISNKFFDYIRNEIDLSAVRSDCQNDSKHLDSETGNLSKQTFIWKLFWYMGILGFVCSCPKDNRLNIKGYNSFIYKHFFILFRERGENPSAKTLLPMPKVDFTNPPRGIYIRYANASFRRFRLQLPPPRPGFLVGKECSQVRITTLKPLIFLPLTSG